MVKIKSRNQVLNDIIRDAKKYPKGWSATFGKDKKLLSRDCYIFNPDAGVYLLKEYEKNPFKINGIGGKIARYLDDDIEKTIKKNSGDFGIVQGNVEKIINNIERGISPEKIFNEALKGNDLGLSMPVRGRAFASMDTFTNLHDMLYSKQKKLDLRFEKMMEDEGVYKSYI